MNFIADSLDRLPSQWQLTPLGRRDPQTGEINPKAPYLFNWQNTDCDRKFIATELESGTAVGIGLRLGKPSGYVVAIDFDGQSAIDFWTEAFGEVPHTVTWTSGKPGRYQALFQVPPEYQHRLTNKKVKAGGDYLEFRYTGNQSVLPPSPHPETEGYIWINSPTDTPVVVLPQPVIDYWMELIEPPLRVPTSRNKPKPQPKTISVTPPIPLEKCLAKSNRDSLEGVHKGSRNDSGFKLACDLIGTANYLESQGIEYEGTPQDLFDRFAIGCTPALNGEANTIWRSASNSNPEPACQVDGVNTVVEAWRKTHSHENYQQISKSFETITSTGVEGVDDLSAPYQQLSADRLKKRVESIVKRGLTGADRESALVALASELRIPKLSLERIYKELERSADTSADNTDLEKILSAQRHQLSPSEIFPDRVATKIKQIAKARGTNSEPLILGLLIAASSVPHANTRLNVANHGDVLSVYPNLFGMTVGDSGSLKSPTNGTSFTKPLRALQKTYIDKYEIELQDYYAKQQDWEKEDKKERGEAPKPPRLVVVVAEDATMEKIEDLALHQPSICPGIYRDELIGIFQAFDKHGGKGSNDSRAKLLSYYDGSPINIHRVGTGSKISKHDYHPVVFGGIQPEVLKDLARSIGMDNDGTLCRFLYAPVIRQYKAWDENPDTEKIDTNAFNKLVENIHGLPAIACSLDEESQKAFAQVANHYNHECLDNPRLSPWLKHAYSKAIGQLGKIALTLHLVECAESNNISAIISKQTIEKAALALNYFISQSISLIASTEETLEAHLVRILDKAKKLGTIKPREVQVMFSGKKRIDSAIARNYLERLAASGYGSIDDSGVFTPKILELAPNAGADNADKVLISYQPLESTLGNSLDTSVDNADNFNRSILTGVNGSKNNVAVLPIHPNGNRSTEVVSTEPKPLKVGDRVKNRETGEVGILSIWYRDRSKATIQSGEGISDWIPVKNLELVEVA